MFSAYVHALSQPVSAGNGLLYASGRYHHPTALLPRSYLQLRPAFGSEIHLQKHLNKSESAGASKKVLEDEDYGCHLFNRVFYSLDTYT